MKQLITRLIKEEAGQDLIEYGLLAAMVALAIAIGMIALAGGINSKFQDVNTTLSSVAS